MKRKCLVCGKEFNARPDRVKMGFGKFCSKKCSGKFRSKRVIKTCLQCKKEFLFVPSPSRIKNGGGKYCSKKCHGKAQKKTIIRKCLICGKRLQITPSVIKIGQGKYCSRKCLFESLRGRKLSKEHKRKLSKSLMGRKMSEESKKKMSEARKGNKNWNWKGGISSKNTRIRSSREYKAWHENVLKRDYWICQKCKKKSNKLNVHHIENFADYPKIRFDVDNGITFCKKCHFEFHKIYGRKGTTRPQVEEFLTL